MTPASYVAGFLFASSLISTYGCMVRPGEIVEYRSGWRTVRVERIIDSEQLTARQKASECVANAGLEEAVHTRFAVVSYVQGRLKLTRVLPVSETAPWNIGDHLRVNVQDCNAPITVAPATQ